MCKLQDRTARACSGAIGPVLSTILVVPVCYGPSMPVGSSNYIEIGQSSNWLRTDRGASLNGASTQGTSRCHGSSGAGARGTCDRCDQKLGDWAGRGLPIAGATSRSLLLGFLAMPLSPGYSAVAGFCCHRAPAVPFYFPIPFRSGSLILSRQPGPAS